MDRLKFNYLNYFFTSDTLLSVFTVLILCITSLFLIHFLTNGLMNYLFRDKASKHFNFLIFLFISLVFCFPLLFKSLYNHFPQLYKLDENYLLSVNNRLESTKSYFNINDSTYNYLCEIKLLEDGLDKGLENKLKLNYLDSITVFSEAGDKIYPLVDKRNSNGIIAGGGMKIPENYIYFYYKNKVSKTKYFDHELIIYSINDYLAKYEDLNIKSHNLDKNLNFFDFLISSISLFKFNSIIPNSNLIKCLVIVNGFVIFIFTFLVSSFLNKFFVTDKSNV